MKDTKVGAVQKEILIKNIDNINKKNEKQFNHFYQLNERER